MKATMPIVVLLASALQGQLYEVKKFGIPQATLRHPLASSRQKPWESTKTAQSLLTE